MTNTRRKSSPNWAEFGGYQSPNYTMVPDQLFDEHLAYLSGAELKVLLYIVRRTFGFKKDSDSISLSQMLNGIETRDGRVLDRGVGLTKKTLLQALHSLQDKHLILAERQQSLERGNEATRYSLKMASGSLGEKITPPLGEKFRQGGEEEIPPSPRGKKSPTQETVLQETEEQDTDQSNLRKVKTSETNNLLTHVDPFPIKEEQTKSDTPPADTTLPDAAERPPTSPTSVGALLSQRMEKQRPSGPVARQDGHSEPRPRRKGPRVEVPAQIRDVVEQTTTEFHDAPYLLVSNLTQAMNLYQNSGLSEYGFCRVLEDARRATKQAGNIEKPAEGESAYPGLRNRMPYFWTVVRNRIDEFKRSEESAAPEG